MAFRYGWQGPKIINEGLVLYLDAGSPNSFYPQIDGTTWKDISSRGNNGTMFNTVPFEVDVVPCFNCATITGGVGNGSFGFTFSSNMIPTTGNFTFSCWIKNPNATGPIGLFANTGTSTGYRWGVSRVGAFYLIGPTYQEGTINFTSQLLTTQWYNVTTVFNRTTAQIISYLDGTYQGIANIPASQTAFSNTAPGLIRSVGGALYTGKLANLLAYNRALTAQEILQNYNATKTRFGLI
jgi:hypothetical protein